MTEVRFYPDDVIPRVSTFEFHRDRPRARHLEQDGHRQRLYAAANYVRIATEVDYLTVSDLGMGDGGLLSLVQSLPTVAKAWGYDWQPSNEDGWTERGVDGRLLDVFSARSALASVSVGDVVVVTEVLEHLNDPHEVVRWLGEYPSVRYLVASSPWGETQMVHDDCHVWGWDFAGYADLIGGGGFRLLRHEPVGRFQLVLAVRR